MGSGTNGERALSCAGAAWHQISSMPQVEFHRWSFEVRDGWRRGILAVLARVIWPAVFLTRTAPHNPNDIQVEEPGEAADNRRRRHVASAPFTPRCPVLPHRLRRSDGSHDH